VRTRRQRNADVKLMVAATVAVLLAGLLIGAGFVVAANNGGSRATCGRYPAGTADGIRTDLQTGGPFFQTGGARCSFWLALQDGDIVAYRTEQPNNCTLKMQREKFVCGGHLVDVTTLAQYPVSIQSHAGIDTVIVDLNPPTASTTSTTSVPA
jgi:hypothetical protein